MNFAKFKNVVSRLRLILLSMLALVVLVAIIGAYQLLALRQTQSSLIEESVPALKESHQLVSLLADKLFLTDQLRVLQTAPAVNKTATTIYDNLDALRELTTRIKGSASTTTAAVRGFEQQIAGMQATVNGLVEHRLSIIELTGQLKDLRSNLKELHERFRIVSEPAITGVTTRLGQNLKTLASTSPSKRPALVDEIRELLAQETRIVSIDTQTSNTIFSAEQLGIQSLPAEISIAVNRISFGLRGTIQVLSELERGETQRAMASMIKELRLILLGKQGLIENLRQRHQTEQDFALLRQDQLNFASNIAAVADSRVNDARNEVRFKSEVLDSELINTIVGLLITTLVAAVLVGVVMYYVVERQVGQRMTQLTQAVLDIAGGDHNREINVKGTDELGSMASSLEVFKRNARELTRSNAELETFAYAASHDLRTPLSAIQSLATWTLEDNSDELSEEATDNLKMILIRAKRLSELQSGLLEYARAGNDHRDLQFFSLRQVTEEIVELLEIAGDFQLKLNAAVDDIFTYETPLRQILMNLISNSVKHHDRESGLVTITAEIRGKKLHCQVSDDGPGIDPQYHDRVFDLFQTLRSRDEIEGSGLGLSLVRKIVERYGGKIRAISEPAIHRGTSFEFDFPVFSESSAVAAGATVARRAATSLSNFRHESSPESSPESRPGPSQKKPRTDK